MKEVQNVDKSKANSSLKGFTEIINAIKKESKSEGSDP